MPPQFSAAYFFDYKHFRHGSLFEKCTFVWEALSEIVPYLQSQTLGKIEVDIPKEAYLIHPELITIGKGTIVEPGAYIHGPCIIGAKCSIRHGAYIRGNVITGDHCVIGHDTEIKNAILLDSSHAAHFAYVGDSILGNQVNLGAGTKFANLKLDNTPIIIRFENQTYATGLRKLGAIVGDNTQLGCNAVTNPGTLVGKNVHAYPCTNFGGFIPSDQTIRSSATMLIKPRTRFP
jgi:UDP-N-acetylglucosamine diphosphorylase / glucose-1-phosphate thymidylyltransferase / UDP-N-acetylgalactosamine diphosphorylase / glucosamine-1-phosphate N-acetyltransferase / galactosamine-1-phosphate N-acetyltransferase